MVAPAAAVTAYHILPEGAAAGTTTVWVKRLKRGPVAEWVFQMRVISSNPSLGYAILVTEGGLETMNQLMEHQRQHEQEWRQRQQQQGGQQQQQDEQYWFDVHDGDMEEVLDMPLRLCSFRKDLYVHSLFDVPVRFDSSVSAFMGRLVKMSSGQEWGDYSGVQAWPGDAGGALVVLHGYLIAVHITHFGVTGLPNSIAIILNLSSLHGTRSPEEFLADLVDAGFGQCHLAVLAPAFRAHLDAAL